MVPECSTFCRSSNACISLYFDVDTEIHTKHRYLDMHGRYSPPLDGTHSRVKFGTVLSQGGCAGFATSRGNGLICCTSRRPFASFSQFLHLAVTSFRPFMGTFMLVFRSLRSPVYDSVHALPTARVHADERGREGEMGCLTSLVHASCCQRTQEYGAQVTTALSFFTPINCERE